MALQRSIFQTRQYLFRCPIVQIKVSQLCSNSRHSYSSKSDQSSRKYTNRHEWVTVEKDIGTIGISKYAQDSLGDIVFAQLPDIGTKLEAGDECGALESVKAASEIYSPVSGTVTEKNRKVEDKPGLINTSCYDDGWLYKLKLTKPEEIKDLMDETQYEQFLKTDFEQEHT
ncbi:unnamed protein product [Diatraea saccharalis]|uniref:Glycine cleavage system H protein n=1 Tax=Diatraea saccharalis TaxID=40085 RepID=A0A9N9WJ26_9NEOP|nr:unnamed protein product [Diatraea saccharalis]